MVRFSEGPEVEVSVDIDASPATVWHLVTDINVPARFQDEFLGASWNEDGPALGASFQGRNTNGDREWETTSWVVEFEPEQAFGWAVSDRDDPGATWTYRLASSERGTLLTYHRLLGPGPSGMTRIIEKYPDREEELIAQRDEVHRRHMQSVIEGIKALAESG